MSSADLSGLSQRVERKVSAIAKHPASRHRAGRCPEAFALTDAVRLPARIAVERDELLLSLTSVLRLV